MPWNLDEKISAPMYHEHETSIQTLKCAKNYMVTRDEVPWFTEITLCHWI